jgi:hypothetical protein
MRLRFALALCVVFAPGCDDSDGGGQLQQRAGDGGAAGTSATLDAGADRGSAGAGSAGGAGEGDGACAVPPGTYEASYEAQSGTCGALDSPARVPIDVNRSGVTTNIQRFAGGDVTTEAVLEDCVLHVSQNFTDTTGLTLMTIDAVLPIEAGARIAGTATVTRFDPTGQVACTGEYGVELVRGGTLGTAGSGEDGGPGAGPDASGDLTADVRAAVDHDCAETLACNLQRGLDLPPDPMATCVRDTTERVTSAGADLAAYLEIVDACRTFVACDYVACVEEQRR